MRDVLNRKAEAELVRVWRTQRPLRLRRVLLAGLGTGRVGCAAATVNDDRSGVPNVEAIIRSLTYSEPRRRGFFR